MAERTQFSEELQKLIARVEKTGASFKKNRHGWGFFNANDKALKQLRGMAAEVQFLDLFESCDAGEVSDEGLAHVGGMSNLRYLALGPGVTDVGLSHLGPLSELRELRLDSASDVTDVGLEHLKNLTRLQSLSLQYTDVSSAGLVHLSGLKQLKELNLEGTAVTKKAVGELQKKLPRCKILWVASKVKKAPKSQATPSLPADRHLSLRMTLRGHADKVGDAAFSPDGSLLVSVAFNKVILWEATSGKKRGEVVVKRGALWGAAFSPDGKLVASGSNLGCVFVWDASSAKEKRCLDSPTAVSTALDIDSGGRYLAAGGDDGNVHLWEFASGKPLAKIPAKAGDYFAAVAFSPDATTLASCGRQPFVCLWKVPSGEKTIELHGPPKRQSTR